VEAGSTQTAYTTFDASAPLDDERAWDPNVDVIITGEVSLHWFEAHQLLISAFRRRNDTR
jgi:putative NIF3 family GTP cyclohydrolase 1 type 2